MSPTKAFAGVFGGVYLLVGLVGFAVTGGSMSTHQLLGIFDLNVVHNIVHIAIGLLGLGAFAAGAAASRTYAIGLAVVYLVVAAAGFVTQPFLGIIPVGGADIGLHVATALVAIVAVAMSGGTVAASARRA